MVDVLYTTEQVDIHVSSRKIYINLNLSEMVSTTLKATSTQI